jgi:hypothetical protein
VPRLSSRFQANLSLARWLFPAGADGVAGGARAGVETHTPRALFGFADICPEPVLLVFSFLFFSSSVSRPFFIDTPQEMQHEPTKSFH